MPRSDDWQRSAMAETVCLPSSIAVNNSTSTAAFTAAVRVYANIASNNNSGLGADCALMVSAPFARTDILAYGRQIAGVRCAATYETHPFDWCARHERHHGTRLRPSLIR